MSVGGVSWLPNEHFCPQNVDVRNGKNGHGEGFLASLIILLIQFSNIVKTK